MARQITSPRFEPAEYRHVTYRAIAEAGTTLDDVLHPEYFANVAGGLKPTDIIRVFWEDRSGYAELVILHVASATVVTRAVVAVRFADAEPAKAPPVGFKVEFTGDHTKWRVVRESDAHVMKDGLGTEGQAKAWLTQHLKTLAS